jgi:hypothetical protein
MESDPAVDRFGTALTSIPSCALDSEGRRAQTARYDAVAGSVAAVRREPDGVFVEFEERVDPVLVDEIIAVERDCCPWLHLEFDQAARHLAVTVTEVSMLPALDAIAAAFAGDEGWA